MELERELNYLFSFLSLLSAEHEQEKRASVIAQIETILTQLKEQKTDENLPN
jgi:hypothetical protein